jgi:sugar phosphate isomerase/epimerase
MSTIKLGATLFCYGTEYARYEFDFAECVKQAALAGATGYEIVGTQMIPNYPNVSKDFLGLVQELKAEYGIGPVGYGANNDKGLMHDRNLTDDEMLADTIIDLKIAHKLGCKVMRSQYMLSPEAFERLAPYAELYDIKVGIEIHNPESPLSPLMTRYLEVIKKTNSKHLGFVPDFGCFAIAPNKAHWIKALEAGVKEEHLQLAADMRYQGEQLEKAREKLMSRGAHPAINAALQGMYGFVQFKPKEELPRMLEELKILPYGVELHGKFHYLERFGRASIPVQGNSGGRERFIFDGYLICEYEDELYAAVRVHKRQIMMEKQLLESQTR